MLILTWLHRTCKHGPLPHPRLPRLKLTSKLRSTRGGWRSSEKGKFKQDATHYRLSSTPKQQARSGKPMSMTCKMIRSMQPQLWSRPERKLPLASPSRISWRRSHHHFTQHSEYSDDEVPSPDESGAKQPTFEGLNSILCEYKLKNIKPDFDSNVSFQVCAEVCEAEAAEVLLSLIHI